MQRVYEWKFKGLHPLWTQEGMPEKRINSGTNGINHAKRGSITIFLSQVIMMMSLGY